MSQRIQRRQFVKASAALAASSMFPSTRPAFAANERLRTAHVGVGGMGGADLNSVSSHSAVEVAALCDVDADILEKATAKFPNARTFRDYREMISEMGDSVDAVVVSTPDHTHAPAAMTALKHDKPVYCQKPLTHEVFEARQLRLVAEKQGLVTQMGIQASAGLPYRQTTTLIQSGVIGKVSRVLAWSFKNWGYDGPAFTKFDDVPKNLDWDLWIGTAPMRPYKEGSYHAFAWRGRMDFGTGAQGDMACHLMDPALWYLELGDPVSVRSVGPVPNGETFPAWSTVHYSFPATRYTVPEGVRVSWYDGGKMPTDKLELFDAGEDVYKNACYFIGEEGALLASPYEPPRLLPERDHPEVPDYDLPKINHWHQWVDACAGRGEATASFDYAGLLTEVALLGNVALRFPDEELQWDAKRLSFPARTEANQYLRRTYRDGWHVRGLG